MSNITEAKCAQCSKLVSLSKDNYILCDGECSQYFHKKCSGLNARELLDLSRNNEEIWFCQSCKLIRTKRKSTALNGSTATSRNDSASSCEVVNKKNEPRINPFQSISKKSSIITRSNSNSRTSSTSTCTDVSLTDVYTKLVELTTKQEDLNTEIRELKDKVIDFQAQTNALAEENTYLRNSHQILKEHINNLEDRLENCKQKSMECDIEIWGIDKTPDENLYTIVMELFSTLEVNITEGQLKDIYRKPTSNENTNMAGIVVKCHRKCTRDNVLSNKKGKHIQWKDSRFNISDMPTTANNVSTHGKPVYINEHITSFKKLLFKKARDLKRSKKVKFAWVKNGSVYIRESEKSKIIHLKQFDQCNEYY